MGCKWVFVARTCFRDVTDQNRAKWPRHNGSNWFDDVLPTLLHVGVTFCLEHSQLKGGWLIVRFIGFRKRYASFKTLK